MLFRSKLIRYRERMGWDFPWVSSAGTDFNKNFNVTFTEAEINSGTAVYNYSDKGPGSAGESPGVSVFVKGEDGAIYHSYSCYARGLETTMAAYNFLDLVPKGRNEGDLDYGTEWLKRHDEY